MLTRSEHLKELRRIEQSLIEMRIIVDVAVRSGSLKYPNSEIGIVKIGDAFRLCVSVDGNDNDWKPATACTDGLLSMITRDSIVRLRECILESKLNMIDQLEKATDNLNYQLSQWSN